MIIDYDHSKNIHSIDGARAALVKLWSNGYPSSLLDVGCGTGTWLRAAIECGVSDVVGIDGSEIPIDRLLFPRQNFRNMDLTKSIDLGRHFGAVICLEVAEHLMEQHAARLVETLTHHSDCVIFSAACPGQIGQHHVNCQWPEYWQRLFNGQEFYCDDDLRWGLWDEPLIEPWYRQNVFVARRDSRLASREPRLGRVIHPEMIPYLKPGGTRESSIHDIEDGRMSMSWYFTSLFKGSAAKVQRRMHLR